MKLIFIHGLGEDESIFDELTPLLGGDHAFINLWDALGTDKRPGVNLIDFSRELVSAYNISPEDVIIGHSLGGRIAYGIKHVNGNRIVQLASWTQQGKPNMPLPSRSLTYSMARTGIMFTMAAKNHLLGQYRRLETKKYYEQAFDNLANGNRNCVVNQLKLVLDPLTEKIDVEPDIRIHALKDNIVRYPNESFLEVPGDHFSLVTHPTEVANAIKGTFNKLSTH